MLPLDGDATANTLPAGSQAERYGVLRYSLPVHCLVPMFQRRTVLSTLHEMKLSAPGCRARFVTEPSWPSK